MYQSKKQDMNKSNPQPFESPYLKALIAVKKQIDKV